MIKLATVLLMAVALTGCVKYTNSEGAKCTTSLDPTVWAMTGVNAVGGIDTTDMIHSCKPAE